jgi:hypothetical protein
MQFKKDEAKEIRNPKSEGREGTSNQATAEALTRVDHL